MKKVSPEKKSPLSDFNFAFALMSIIPLLIALYLISVQIVSIWRLVGINSFVFAAAVGISLLGLLAGRNIIKSILHDLLHANKQLAELNETLERRVRERTEIAENRAIELARSNAELEIFTHLSAHDLQEPLRSVVSFSQLLEERYKNKLDRDADDFLHYITAGANKMHGLIDGLLRYLEFRDKPVQWESVETQKILDEVLASLSGEIAKKKAQITSPSLPLIRASAPEIKILFEQLIENALRHCGDEAPLIELSFKRQKRALDTAAIAWTPLPHPEQEYWIFSIKDNGPGIEKPYAEKIFRMFQPLDTSSKMRGEGIGLAICKKIIERHEGRIWVDPDLKKGSVFHFTIPVK